MSLSFEAFICAARSVSISAVLCPFMSFICTGRVFTIIVTVREVRGDFLPLYMVAKIASSAAAYPAVSTPKAAFARTDLPMP